MTNDKTHLLSQIFSRLCFYYGAHPEQFQARRKNFVRLLAPYPEDLICACYQHLLHQQHPAHLPHVDDFIAFMQPEYMRRSHLEVMEAV